MAKHDKLTAAMQERKPAAMRQVITPVNILAPESEGKEETEKAHETTVRKDRAEEPHGQPERENRSKRASENSARDNRPQIPRGKSERKHRAIKTSGSTEREKRTVLADTRRQTTRESFEVYADQIERIEVLRELYKKKTGRPLAKSRVVREALDMFLPHAFEAYEDEEE